MIINNYWGIYLHANDYRWFVQIDGLYTFIICLCLFTERVHFLPWRIKCYSIISWICVLFSLTVWSISILDRVVDCYFEVIWLICNHHTFIYLFWLFRWLERKEIGIEQGMTKFLNNITFVCHVHPNLRLPKSLPHTQAQTSSWCVH